MSSQKEKKVDTPPALCDFTIETSPLETKNSVVRGTLEYFPDNAQFLTPTLPMNGSQKNAKKQPHTGKPQETGKAEQQTHHLAFQRLTAKSQTPNSPRITGGAPIPHYFCQEDHTARAKNGSDKRKMISNTTVLGSGHSSHQNRTSEPEMKKVRIDLTSNSSQNAQLDKGRPELSERNQLHIYRHIRKPRSPSKSAATDHFTTERQQFLQYLQPSPTERFYKGANIGLNGNGLDSRFIESKTGAPIIQGQQPALTRDQVTLIQNFVAGAQESNLQQVFAARRLNPHQESAPIQVLNQLPQLPVLSSASVKPSAFSPVMPKVAGYQPLPVSIFLPPPPQGNSLVNFDKNSITAEQVLWNNFLVSAALAPAEPNNYLLNHLAQSQPPAYWGPILSPEFNALCASLSAAAQLNRNPIVTPSTHLPQSVGAVGQPALPFQQQPPVPANLIELILSMQLDQMASFLGMNATGGLNPLQMFNLGSGFGQGPAKDDGNDKDTSGKQSGN